MNVLLKEWVTVPDLIKVLSVSKRSVYRHIHENTLDYKIIKTGTENSYLVNVQSAVNKYGYPDEYIKSGLPSSNLNEKQKRTALAKDTLLRYYVKASELEHGQIKEAKLKFIEKYNNGEILQEVFNILGEKSYKSVERWLKEWLENDRDPFALAPKYRIVKKGRNLTDIEQKTFLEILLKPSCVNISKAYSITKYILENKGYEVKSSEATFRRFAEDYKKENLQVWTLMRSGEKALKDNILPYVERDISLINVGDVLVADGKVTTFDVINPFTGKRSKAVFVAYLDWKSFDIAGYELMITENTQAVTSALRNAILRLGKTPLYVYQDNGKAFKNRFFKGSPAFESLGWTGLFSRLDIVPVWSLPYNGRAKAIEMRWKEIVEGFEKLLQSFTGTSPINKPAYMMRNEKFHKAYHKALGGDFVPTLAQAKDLIEAWLAFYRSQPHPHIKGKTIGQVFNQGRGKGYDKSRLDDLMMKYSDKPLQVYQNGVKLLDASYYNEMLTSLVGQKVQVKYSLNDISEVVVCDVEGRFICRAERVNKVHPLAHHMGTPKDVAELQNQIKLQRNLHRNTINEAKRIISNNQNVSIYSLPEQEQEQEELNVSLLPDEENISTNLKMIGDEINIEEEIYLYEADKKSRSGANRTAQG